MTTIPRQCQPNMVVLTPLQSKRGLVNKPQIPPQPCTAKASRGSSIPIAASERWPSSWKAPPRAPVAMAMEGSTALTPAQIATRPAKMPLHMPHRSYSTGPLAPLCARRKVKTTSPPAAAARVEFIATRAAAVASASLSILSCDPQLKPYQPNHKMKVPSTTKWALDGLKSSGCSQRPLRGPSTAAPVRAPMPPTKCTMPEPAKSL
mmetsp:Transcript_104798/g.197501  ORF Transcript_104798/g.197501 Transcript_104798/m.197501 type:complete len:206 (-) Transcript_104798:10-627(-)